MPSRAVRLGDVITVALDRSVRVLKVAGFAERRGAAETASMLADDMSQPPGEGPVQRAAARAPAREPGTGRPTKRDRRAIDRLLGDDGF